MNMAQATFPLQLAKVVHGVFLSWADHEVGLGTRLGSGINPKESGWIQYNRNIWDDLQGDLPVVQLMVFGFDPEDNLKCK